LTSSSTLYMHVLVREQPVVIALLGEIIGIVFSAGG
jgi:hypothetical protein